MAGTGALTLTGQLGDVMKESARAALSWLRTHAREYGIDPDFFKNAEMHVHVPSGAIPKDGPSAGVTMATAMASELTGRPVRGDIAMTGEITLSGRVLPVGGIKEKVLAARRVGIREVILPKQNAKNVNEDLTPELRQDLTVHLVSTIDEVLALALQPVSSDIRPQKSERETERAEGTQAAFADRRAALSGRRRSSTQPGITSISGCTFFQPGNTSSFANRRPPVRGATGRRCRSSNPSPPRGRSSRSSTPRSIWPGFARGRSPPTRSRSSSCRGRKRWSKGSA